MKKTQKNTLTFIISGLAVLIVIAVLLFIFVFSKGAKQNSGGSIQTAQPPVSTPSAGGPSETAGTAAPPSSSGPIPEPTNTGSTGNENNNTGKPGETASPLPFPYSFEAVDIYGNTVTEKSLGEKEVFFIHFWSTWCPPCIGEIPDLAKLALAYGDRVGFLGLLDDFDTNSSGAISIVESAGMPDSFIMVDAYLPVLEPVFKMLRTGYLPTTVLLYKGEEAGTYIGAYGEKYAEILDELLNRQ